MSRLIAIDPDTCQNLEPEGQEHGYCVPYVSTIKKVSPKANITLNEKTVSLPDSGTDVQLNITQEDPFCKRIVGLLKSSKLETNIIHIIWKMSC